MSPRKLHRTSLIHHRGTGVKIRTPLLVPSFSSKGFKAAELATIFDSSGAFITETYLISAYDVATRASFETSRLVLQTRFALP